MANVLYPKYKEALLQAGVNLTGAVRVMLVDTGAYTYSADHQYMSDIPVGAWVAISDPLTNKTFAGGVFDADDVTFPAVTGVNAEALVLYLETIEDINPLIAYIDTATGLPVTPNGGDITISWDNGANKIFAL